MATLDDAALIASELPEVSEGTRYGNRTWFVAGRDSPGNGRSARRTSSGSATRTPPDGPIFAVRVADLDEKEEVLAAEPVGFFTIPHFDGYAAVLIQLKKVRKRALRERSPTHGWRARPPSSQISTLSR